MLEAKTLPSGLVPLHTQCFLSFSTDTENIVPVTSTQPRAKVLLPATDTDPPFPCPQRTSLHNLPAPGNSFLKVRSVSTSLLLHQARSTHPSGLTEGPCTRQGIPSGRWSLHYSHSFVKLQSISTSLGVHPDQPAPLTLRDRRRHDRMGAVWLVDIT